MKKYIRTVLDRITADMKEYGVAVAAVLVYAVIVNLIFHAFCPLVILCGLPCPGCGISRATACFITGQWRQAWQLHPVVFPIVAFAAYFFLNRYLLGRQAKGAKALVAIIMGLLLVVYCVRMYLYFPNRVPYVYTRHNLLERFFFLFYR